MSKPRNMPLYYTKDVITDRHWRFIKQWWNENLSVVSMIRRLHQKRLQNHLQSLMTADIYATLFVMHKQGEIDGNRDRGLNELTLAQFHKLFSLWKEGANTVEIIEAVRAIKSTHRASEAQIRSIIRSMQERLRAFAPTKRQQETLEMIAVDTLAFGKRERDNLVIPLREIPSDMLAKLRRLDDRLTKLLFLEPDYRPHKYRDQSTSESITNEEAAILASADTFDGDPANEDELDETEFS